MQKPTDDPNVLEYQTPARRSERFSQIGILRIALVAIAVVLFGISYHFGQQEPFTYGPNGGTSSNVTAGLAAFGFALAGGMALLASAIVGSNRW